MLEKGSKLLFIIVALILIHASSAVHAQDILKAVVVSGDTFLYSLSGVETEIVGKTYEGEIFFVEPLSGDAHHQGQWYKLLYTYSDLEENTLVEPETDIFVDVRYVQVFPLSERENFFLESEKRRLFSTAQQRSAEKRVWKTTGISSGVRDIIGFPMKGIARVPVYIQPDTGSKKVTLLKKGTSVLLSVARLRYDELGVDKEGWVQITRPVKGWVPIQYTELWYSDFYAGLLDMPD